MIEIQDALSNLIVLIQSDQGCNQQSAFRDLLTDAIHIANSFGVDINQAWIGANEVLKEEADPASVFTVAERPVIICTVEGGVMTGAKASIDIEVKVLDLDDEDEKDDASSLLDELDILPHEVY